MMGSHSIGKEYKMKVFNLTKHVMTPAQIQDGGINVPEAQASNNSLFVTLPTSADIQSRAINLVALAVNAGAVAGDSVLVAGAAYWVPAITAAAKTKGLNVVASFTQRVAVETREGDEVKLSYTFKHEGWVVL